MIWAALALLAPGRGAAQDAPAATTTSPETAPALTPLPAPAGPLTPDQIDQLRDELHALQRERETRRAASELIALRPGVALPPGAAPGPLAALRLANAMDTLRAFWILEPEALDRTTSTPLAAAAAQPRRLAQSAKGVEWMTLAPGTWRLRLVVARSDGQPPLRLPERSLRLAAGTAYELALTDEVEQSLEGFLQAQRRAAAEAARAAEAAKPAAPSDHPALPAATPAALPAK